MFSKACQYGLQAIIYIALHHSEKFHIDLTEISKGQNIPKHFLSKVLQLLVKHKLLVSMKGPAGGFRLTRPPEQITLIEIVEAIDGLDIFEQCGIGFKKCSGEDPCPIHHDYKKIRERIKLLLMNKTLKDLEKDVKNGENILKI